MDEVLFAFVLRIVHMCQ